MDANTPCFHEYDAAISHQLAWFAIVSKDGLLRVLNLLSELVANSVVPVFQKGTR